jgi:HSP20 family molecular chaperone IbpA
MSSGKFKRMHLFHFEAEFLRGTRGYSGAEFEPSVDVFETETALVVKMECAGIRADRLNITFSAAERTLTISGERAEASADWSARTRYHQIEIYYGAFERVIALPEGIPLDLERISAHYRDGFLVIQLPRKTQETAARNPNRRASPNPAKQTD